MEAVLDYPLAYIKPQREPKLYTLGEYIIHEEKAQERYDYYNGELKRIPMARGPHNEIAINMATAMKIAFKSQGKNYRVFSSDQNIYLPKLNFGLYPDAVVVCEEPAYYDNNQVLMLNPLLIVEVLSRSTRSYDKGNKFNHYKSADSFREYVLIEQDICQVETRFREEPNVWRETKETNIDNSIDLKSLGCSIALADIYEHIVFKPIKQSRRRF